jgi:hypothetical protein
MRASLGEYVTIELDTDKPYVYNADHAEKYSPKESKGKKQKKWVKKK